MTGKPRDLSRFAAALDAIDDGEANRLTMWLLDMSVLMDRSGLLQGRQFVMACADALLGELTAREAIYASVFLDEPGDVK